MTVSVSITPTQSQAQTALGQFLQSVLPSGVDIIAAQPNRVSEPKNTNFVMMSPMSFQRLSTNFDGWVDVVFTGSVAGTVLTVTNVAHGAILPGSLLFGIDVPNNIKILNQVSGPPGGLGVYTLSSGFTLASQLLESGNIAATMASKMIVQLDFHSADYSSAEMAQTVSTLFRDEYGTRFFAGLAPPLDRITPFHADDPRRAPFINAEQQYEWRWVLDAALQVNQTVLVPQQYADEVKVGRVPVDAFYQ